MTPMERILAIADNSGEVPDVNGKTGLDKVKEILAELSASDPNAGADTRYLLYNSYTGPNATGQNISAQVGNLVDLSDGKLTSIFETEIGKMLNSDNFLNKLSSIMGPGYGLDSSRLQELMGGDIKNNVHVKKSMGSD